MQANWMLTVIWVKNKTFLYLFHHVKIQKIESSYKRHIPDIWLLFQMPRISKLDVHNASVIIYDNYGRAKVVCVINFIRYEKLAKLLKMFITISFSYQCYNWYKARNSFLLTSDCIQLYHNFFSKMENSYKKKTWFHGTSWCFI